MNTTNFKTAYLHDKMARWRHHFHAHPELGLKEHQTASVIVEILENLNIEVTSGMGVTGVVGVLKRGGGPKSIGLRCDMDALAIAEENRFPYRSQKEGKMHACGHDGHMSMLLGAAEHLALKGKFDGTIYFIFQPAEEPGWGAKAMMDDDLFERFPADAVYAMHNMPSLPLGTMAIRPGPVMACEDHFEISIKGCGTHAALPHLGIDSILVGAEIVSSLQSVVSRALDPVDNGVVSVTEFITDGTTNVLPTTVTLKGDTRSFLPRVQDRIEKTMDRISRSICAAHGAGCDFTYTHEFVSTINTPKEAAIAAEVARSVVGERHLDLEFSPVLASEDFGRMLQVKPGCMVFIGNGTGGETVGLHNPRYDFQDKNLPIGADFWVQLVETQLPAN
jgi:hippurate hydrolase